VAFLVQKSRYFRVASSIKQKILMRLPWFYMMTQTPTAAVHFDNRIQYRTMESAFLLKNRTLLYANG